MSESILMNLKENSIGQVRDRSLTITEKLLSEKHSLEDRLRQVNEALSALEANPEFQKIFDLVSKTVRY